MAGMKRFVTYIYAYEDKKKTNNVGFAKIEIRGEDCRIAIHLRGVYARQAACVIYLFRENAGKIVGIEIGELRLVNGNGDFSGVIKAGGIGESPFGIFDMEGIFLLAEDDCIFMSRWKDGKPLEVSREAFCVWQVETEQVAAAENIQPKEASQEEPGKEADTGEARQEASKQDMQATEVPMCNIFPNDDWQSAWEALTQSRRLYHPFEDCMTECIQIELKNLRELPKRYWYLGNNSFLLHGFFNYHYLVVGKTAEDRWFIGIPGIYQRQERVMAAIFGFGEFLALAEDEEEKGKQENDEPINRFGCWCRFVEIMGN